MDTADGHTQKAALRAPDNVEIQAERISQGKEGDFPLRKQKRLGEP